MKITKTEFEQLLDKIVSSLTTHFNDPKVIDYNFYNNASGVGVKMMRKGKKMTIEDLALTVHDLALTVNSLKLTVHNLTLEMHAGFSKQEEFNKEVRDFMRDQKSFNERIEQDIKEIKSCPTIAREIAEMKISKDL